VKVRPFVLLIAAIGLLTVPQAAGAAVVTVHVFSFDFSTNPSGQAIVDPTIKVGDTIRWVFDEGGHTTTSVAGIPEQWNSGFVNSGGQFTHTFTHVGNFEYYCQPHGFDAGGGNAEGMSGVIRVQPVPEPTGAAVLAAAAALRRRRRQPA
jgi:plastocyanin